MSFSARRAAFALLAAAGPAGAQTLDRTALGPPSFAEDFDRPLDLYAADARPHGRWKTSYDFGWRQGASSRTLKGEFQVYSDAGYNGVDPFAVAGGALTITARRNPRPADPRSGAKPYTSGLLSTSAAFRQRYGYFEVRAALPAIPGAWPAFWLAAPLDPRITAPQHPGEIDVMEAMGREPDRIFCSAHWPDGRGGYPYRTRRVAVPEFTAMHSYGVLWTARRITWYRDDREVAQMVNPGLRQPMMILLDLAVGGWDANVPDTLSPPMRMTVDWVRAYPLAGPAASAQGR